MDWWKKIGLSCMLLCCAMAGDAQALYGNNAIAGHYYSLRGTRFYVEEYGKGDPVILLHGNGGSISSMASLIPYFSKEHRIIAIDSRAQGKSLDDGDSLSFEMMADDVAAVMKEKHIDSANFIGWSDGGIIALEMAIRHPNMVKKLAATGANIRPDSTAFPAEVWLDWQKNYLADKDKKWSTKEEKNNWKLFLLDWLQPNISWNMLESIHKPALIIAGDRDLIRPEHTVEIFQHIPNAQLWIVPHSGHGTLIDQTDSFCRTVDQFFKE